MMEWLKRSEAVLGAESLDILQRARVAVFGLGGVGSACAEALVRAGVGSLVLIDSDIIQESNLNRQLIALRSNLGMKKTEVCKQRYNDINPDINIEVHTLFYSADTAEQINFKALDYAVDAVDTLEAKLLIVKKAQTANCPVLSCLGTGNRLDAGEFQFMDIYETSVCPLARRMRKACREQGIESLRVLSSREEAIKVTFHSPEGKNSPGSVSFVPPVAGMLMAGEVIRNLIHLQSNHHR